MASTPKSLRQPTSPANSGGNPLVRRRVLASAREIERDCKISARCHFSAATFWYTIYYALGLPTTVLAAVAGISALKEQTFVAAVLAMLVAALSATMTFLNAGERAQAHSKKRAQYEELKNAVRFFREVTLAMNPRDAELVKELARHGRARNQLNRESPQVRQKFFVRAAEAIGLEERRRPALREDVSERTGVLARLGEQLVARLGRPQT